MFRFWMMILVSILLPLSTIPPPTYVWAYKEVECDFCHIDQYVQLNLSPSHKGWGEPGKADTSDCNACHVVEFYEAGEFPSTPHATFNIECLNCHSEGGFLPLRQFCIEHVDELERYEDVNYFCIACHTSSPQVSGLALKKTVISIESVPDRNGKWTVKVSVERGGWSKEGGFGEVSSR
jgi:hypothetical protein